jgi:DNA topoisomerase-1
VLLGAILVCKQLAIYAGGVGSGCHGDNCGRPSSGLVPVSFSNGMHKLATGEALPKHLQKVRIPPAWSDVHVNIDPKEALWVKGRDVKGRTQSIYSPKFANSQALQKFARVQKLEQKFATVEAKNEKYRGSKDQEKKDSADALKLIFHTGIRPGSEKDTGAEKQAYGATTLLGKHLVQNEDGMSLQFTGKKGVDLNIPITDKDVASMLSARASSSGAEGKLFPNTSAASLLDHTHSIGGQIKTKDFRTLLANRIAKEQVANTQVPVSAKDYKKAVKAVATVVASKLGNTASIALKSYINPHVFSAWQGASA